MKKSPQTNRLEEVLRSTKLVAGSFMGTDPRNLDEVIDADARELARTGCSLRSLAARMRELSECADRGLGSRVTVDDRIEVAASDSRGDIVCPWPHMARASKTVYTVRRLDTGTQITWSELSIHLVEEHGFFGGKGSTFRLEPGDLVDLIIT